MTETLPTLVIPSTGEIVSSAPVSSAAVVTDELAPTAEPTPIVGEVVAEPAQEVVPAAKLETGMSIFQILGIGADGVPTASVPAVLAAMKQSIESRNVVLDAAIEASRQADFWKAVQDQAKNVLKQHARETSPGKGWSAATDYGSVNVTVTTKTDPEKLLDIVNTTIAGQTDERVIALLKSSIQTKYVVDTKILGTEKFGKDLITSARKEETQSATIKYPKAAKTA